jgi:hypothetical protein
MTIVYHAHCFAAISVLIAVLLRRTRSMMRPTGVDPSGSTSTTSLSGLSTSIHRQALGAFPCRDFFFRQKDRQVGPNVSLSLRMKMVTAQVVFVLPVCGMAELCRLTINCGVK